MVRLGREERKLGATGTEGISVKEIRLRDVLKEHSDASKKYIDGLQASILGETVKKIFLHTKPPPFYYKILTWHKMIIR